MSVEGIIQLLESGQVDITQSVKRVWLDCLIGVYHQSALLLEFCQLPEAKLR